MSSKTPFYPNFSSRLYSTIKKMYGLCQNAEYRVQNFADYTDIQPPIQWVPGTLSPGVKWLGREADH
jgi:hypothetical protein